MVSTATALIRRITTRTPVPSRNRFPPQHLFPIELWENIFHHLSSDEDLLRIAPVCKAFCILYIRIFLPRHNYSNSVFSSTNITVAAPVLAAFHLSFRTFPLRKLGCYLGPLKLRRDFGFIQEIIHRSRHLTQLHLHFHDDLFRVPQDEPSSEEVMSRFCAVLSDMANRVEGPVIVVSRGHIFSCRQQDIAGWKLHLGQFNDASRLSIRARRALYASETSPTSPCTRIRFHDGKWHQVKALTKLHSATIRSITEGSLLMPTFTTLIFDMDAIKCLSLGRPDLWIRGPPDYFDLPFKTLMGPELDAALLHLSFLRLRTLRIHTDTISPAALGQFLLNIPRLQDLECWGHHDEELDSHRALVDPPITHPGLQKITTNSRMLGRVIRGLDTSPLVHTFRFIFPLCPTDATMAGFLVDLAKISWRTQDTTLDITFMGLWQWGVGGYNLARSLQCVHRVEMSCYDMEGVVLNMLGWLALFPSLLHVKFIFLVERPEDTPEELMVHADKLSRFLKHAYKALPRIPRVTGHLRMITAK
ncbi:hypothetical protein DFH06DRAFT_1318941 [Mycena polygramma]|nr:hypothetical protein DFH06DRAFT_1318941 [Mycena polygramma]